MKRFSLSRVFGKAHATLATHQLNRPVYRRQRGASAIEYVVIASVMALGIYVAVNALDLDTAFTTFFTNVKSALNKS